MATTRETLARRLAHQLCQWPSRAARANLPAAADDSHSNLGWVVAHGGLFCHVLNHHYSLGFSFSEARLHWLIDGRLAAVIDIAGRTDHAVGLAVDALLQNAGLSATHDAAMPYQLGHNHDYQRIAELGAELAVLGAHFNRAHQALQQLSLRLTDRYEPGTSTVRCWPHHFDLAMLVSLEPGSPETARAIGVGLSPGDSAIGDPYYYCNPWPITAASGLPAPPPGFHWHTDGFTSLICPATESPVDLSTPFNTALAYLSGGQHGIHTT